MLIDQADTPLQLCAIHRTIPRLHADHGREGLGRSAATTSAGTPAATRRWPS